MDERGREPQALESENYVARLHPFLTALSGRNRAETVPQALGAVLDCEVDSVRLHERYVLLVELARRAHLQALTEMPAEPGAEKYIKALESFGARWLR